MTKLAAFVLFAFGLFSCVAHAAPPNDPSYVTVNAQAGLQNSRTNCITLTNAAAVNLWASAPASVTDVAVLNQIRYIRIQNVTAGITDPFSNGYMFYRIGQSTDSPALTSTIGVRLLTGQTDQIQLQRPNNGATISVSPGFPTNVTPIWIRGIDAAQTVCLTWFW